MLLLVLGCNPCDPGESTLELGHWNDVLLPQGVSACTHYTVPRNQLLVKSSGTPDELAQQMTDALGRVGWTPLEPGVLVREGQKTTITATAPETGTQATLALSDHFDRARKYPDWDARMAAAAAVEVRLLEGPPDSAPETCPEGTDTGGFVDLRDLANDPDGGHHGFATTSTWKAHLGLPPIANDGDLAFHQARYDYAKALAEQPVGAGTVLDVIAAGDASDDRFQAGHVLGVVWILGPDGALCSAPFTATNSAVIEVSPRGDDDDAVRSDLIGRTTDAMHATYNALRGR